MKNINFFRGTASAMLLSAALISNQASAQLKLTSANKLQVGYDVYTPLLFGSYPSAGVNNGRWGIEYWDSAPGGGGLNFWIPWPNPTSQNNALFIKDNGYVGIGKTNPLYRLDVAGPIAINGTVVLSSDERLKKEIKPLTSALSKLNLLNGKSYLKFLPEPTFSIEGETDEVKKQTILSQKASFKNEGAPEFGFIAQEMQKVFPELVKPVSDGLLGIDYLGLIPVLVEAIKEQDKKIEGLNAQLTQCCNSNILQPSGTGKDVDTDVNIPTLSQNNPNPFNQSTSIGFYIPAKASKAVLNVYDMQGTEIRSYPVNGRENQSVTIQASELKPGMYLYALIVDGKEVDTKRMILTK